MQNRSFVRIAALGATAVLALAGCSSSKKDSGSGGGLGGSSASSGGGSGSSGKTYKIGFEGPLSGDNQQLGINELNGAKLAVQQANQKSDLGFKVALVESDDGGDPAKAPAAAAKLIQDTAILGVIGPSFSGATKATGKTYGGENIATINPSATNGTLQDQGFTTFHRIVPNDNVEGTAAADWFARKGLKKVFVVDDLSDYGKGVADAIQKELEAKGVSVTRKGVDAKTDDYGAISQTVKSSGAAALFYGGYDAQAAKFAQALKATGYKGLTVTGNGGKSSVFTKGAGPAGNGWYFTCGCQDATVAASAKDFTAAYKAQFKTDPSTYSPEAYDAANAFVQAIKDAAAKGDVTRKSLNDAVNALNYTGITTTIKFGSNGELDGTPPVNLYIQQNGAIKSIGLISEQK
ncbi:MAG: branched-chain amino acid ABC transporter substrate-binding protein [bacterium]